MNQNFSIKRFRLLVKLEIAERGRNYVLMGSLLVGLMLVLMLPMTINKGYSGLLNLLHPLALFMVLLFGGSLYTSQAFMHYGSPSTGIAALMIPASRLEKYLCALLINLLFVVPFLLLFLFLHSWAVDYANQGLSADSYKYSRIPRDPLMYFAILYLLIQGTVMLGSLYFARLSYVKTAAAFFISFVVITFLSMLMAFVFTDFPTKVVAFPFSSWRIWFGMAGTVYFVEYPREVQYLVYLFPFILLLGLWYTTYVRLTEKEI
ncbi:hypothetical protein [Telluribacter sp. SYSU D00476]|uniref:hypothetical protein n=1 Tax=Telluribacter sp. SYSU D00476 TaxID=2811430 RepID=UPI001FF11984|nr:hypothetical protein [Telluribacter sp. SYSU D00476]